MNLKRTGIGVLTVVALCCVLSDRGHAANATSEIASPDDYACPKRGFITFEQFSDGDDLSADAIQSVWFTTTNGYTWKVGDFATGSYNGKYPAGAYMSEGTRWAWLGEDQGAGRIDFVRRASYVSLLVSVASSPVVLEAYDNAGRLLETAGPAVPNIDTGRMTELRIERDARDIAHVVVHDSGNYFLVDAICTDAPGVSNDSYRPTLLSPALGARIGGSLGRFKFLPGDAIPPGGYIDFRVNVARHPCPGVTGPVEFAASVFPGGLAGRPLTGLLRLDPNEHYRWSVVARYADGESVSQEWEFQTGGTLVSRAARMSVKKRFDIVDEFFREYGDGDELGYGTAIEHFMDWERASSRLDESQWWRAVNGMMMLDLQEAQRLVRRRGGAATSGSPTVQAWIDFATATQDRQWLLWVAHNRSIHRGVRAARSLLEDESGGEKTFIDSVIMNVDIAGLSDFSTKGGSLDSKAFDYYVDHYYPDGYPASWGDADRSTFLQDLLNAGNSGLQYLEALNLIGQCASQWPPPGWEP